MKLKPLVVWLPLMFLVAACMVQEDSAGHKDILPGPLPSDPDRFIGNVGTRNIEAIGVLSVERTNDGYRYALTGEAGNQVTIKVPIIKAPKDESGRPVEEGEELFRAPKKRLVGDRLFLEFAPKYSGYGPLTVSGMRTTSRPVTEEEVFSFSYMIVTRIMVCDEFAKRRCFNITFEEL